MAYNAYHATTATTATTAPQMMPAGHDRRPYGHLCPLHGYCADTRAAARPSGKHIAHSVWTAASGTPACGSASGAPGCPRAC